VIQTESIHYCGLTASLCPVLRSKVSSNQPLHGYGFHDNNNIANEFAKILVKSILILAVTVSHAKSFYQHAPAIFVIEFL
jgi:hypothetical protein